MGLLHLQLEMSAMKDVYKVVSAQETHHVLLCYRVCLVDHDLHFLCQLGKRFAFASPLHLQMCHVHLFLLEVAEAAPQDF
ncbi:hypothetical protein E2C01_028456 [Portunus trituberculatus]|uniref:Uncharacterized protein n=1 Tax=Portunus trituberculatus TaxID=210409 RepID=A0A5B7EP61_PORTR|nr:hypothetical protein [Portunus trituberculatus]